MGGGEPRRGGEPRGVRSLGWMGGWGWEWEPGVGGAGMGAWGGWGWDGSMGWVGLGPGHGVHGSIAIVRLIISVDSVQ